MVIDEGFDQLDLDLDHVVGLYWLTFVVCNVQYGLVGMLCAIMLVFGGEMEIVGSEEGYTSVDVWYVLIGCLGWKG